VVHVYEWRIVGARIQVGGAHTDDAKAHAEALVESAVAHARSFAPGVSVRGDAVRGSAGPILVGVSANADMVVVGSRGRGGFASLLLGSVSRQVATRAPGPVVVVRGRPDISVSWPFAPTPGQAAGGVRCGAPCGGLGRAQGARTLAPVR
jgi:nucleotide-binding universal stress UspA family protein